MLDADFISADELASLISLRDGVMFWEPRGVPRFDRLHAGNPVHLRSNCNGYFYIRLRKREIAAHRAIWTLYYGAWPTAYIDHINRDRADNRIENLRDVPMVVNNLNTDRSATGGGGVHRPSRGGSWVAQIRYRGQLEHLGSFPTRAGALHARREAELRIYGCVFDAKGGRAAGNGRGGASYRADGHPSDIQTVVIAHSHRERL